MKEEVVANLVTNNSGIYLDCTIGFGGHSDGILDKLDNKGQIIGLDCDLDAFNYSKKKFKKLDTRVKVFNSNYMDYEQVLDSLDISEIDGALLDLGISSYQIDEPRKGFSYRYDGPLDMRFDVNRSITAFDVLNKYSEKKLSFIIKNYGEEKNYNKIAKSIVKSAKRKTMNSTNDLKNAIKEVSYGPRINKTLSRVFQSIRMKINNEIENLNLFLMNSLKYLTKGGRLVIITFHSLEDSIIKHFFKDNAISCICPPSFPICNCNYKAKLKIIHKKGIFPSKEEIKNNPRARSAKLRIAECL